MSPSQAPSNQPTLIPTAGPTLGPTLGPTVMPTLLPSMSPTRLPTTDPTLSPTRLPTPFPTRDFQTTWNIIIEGITKDEIESTRIPVAKTLGVSLGQVILMSYSSVIVGQRTVNPITWSVEYAIEAETIDDAKALTEQLLTTGDTIKIVLLLEFEAELEKSVILKVPAQNLTMVAWTDPPTTMPTSGPSLKSTLSPTRDVQFDPTKEPSEHPSWLPTQRPSFFPSQPPTHLPTNIPDIQAVFAQFNSNWLSIAIGFDIATNQPGAPESFDCGYIIDKSTVKLLGEGSRCE